MPSSSLQALFSCDVYAYMQAKHLYSNYESKNI